MSHDLVLQTKIGREETLEKFLHTIGKKGTIKDPCAVRLRRVNREEFEARWAQKARALQIDANWIEPGLKLKNFKLFATDMDSTFLNLETLDEMASFVGKGEEVAHITELAMQGKIRNYAESLTARVKLMKSWLLPSKKPEFRCCLSRAVLAASQKLLRSATGSRT